MSLFSVCEDQKETIKNLDKTAELENIKSDLRKYINNQIRTNGYDLWSELDFNESDLNEMAERIYVEMKIDKAKTEQKRKEQKRIWKRQQKYCRR